LYIDINKLQFGLITYNDLDEIRDLQPDGWSDIASEFEYYIERAFCYPVKAKLNDKIVGTGASIVFGKTCWLAHIIVHKDFRRRGIGYRIVEELLKNNINQSVETYLLIATELGQPVYSKAGFRIVSEYAYLKRNKPWIESPVSQNIVPYTTEYCSTIVELDRKISGEDREILLSEFLGNSIVYIENNEVKGYYIPDLGEGLIFADNEDAGIELMKIKYSGVDKAVLPSDNHAGIAFLKQNGFEEADIKGTRMILGNDINWQPHKIFSRAGGNFG
jgi:GNAT superfamily N-acetyltransferase